MSTKRWIKALETFSDDDATEAVEQLVSAGQKAVEPLCAELDLEKVMQRRNCDRGERLRYILKALRLIGDPRAFRPALTLFCALDDHARADPNWAEEEGGNPNWNGILEALLSFARQIDPKRGEGLPAASSFEAFVAGRREARAAVERILAM